MLTLIQVLKLFPIVSVKLTDGETVAVVMVYTRGVAGRPALERFVEDGPVNDPGDALVSWEKNRASAGVLL